MTKPTELSNIEHLQIQDLQSKLSHHRLFTKLDSLENVQTFMKWHIFAVWDFMSLLKGLQRQITCVELPWRESAFSPELVQLVNEIVLGEESDRDQEGNPMSHFSLYLKGMKEIGANTQLIGDFLSDFKLSLLPSPLAKVLSYHLDLAMNGAVQNIASSFFFGREKLIPEMFTSIVKVLEENQIQAPTLLYYLKRHIEVDGDEHGPKALRCLNELCDSEEKREQVLFEAKKSLEMRHQLWDFILEEIEQPTTHFESMTF